MIGLLVACWAGVGVGIYLLTGSETFLGGWLIGLGVSTVVTLAVTS